MAAFLATAWDLFWVALLVLILVAVGGLVLAMLSVAWGYLLSMVRSSIRTWLRTGRERRGGRR